MEEAIEEYMLSETGERFMPGPDDSNVAIEHYHRYKIACEFAKNKKVLDIASGEGYGSAILAKVAQSIIGVDIAEKAVKYAKIKYKHLKNVEFKQGACSKIPLPSSSIDLVVSFETIEHHDEHEEMMLEIKRVLKPEGMLIISSPDKKEYTDIPGYKNQFHIKELYREEFYDLIKKNFTNVSLYGQRVVYGSGIFVENKVSNFISYDHSKLETSLSTSGMLRPLYLVCVASNEKIISNPISSFCIQDVSKSDFYLQKKAEHNLHVNNLNQSIMHLKAEVTNKNQVIIERDTHITNQNKVIQCLNGNIENQNKVIQCLNGNIESQNKVIQEYDKQISKQNDTIHKRDSFITELTKLLLERDDNNSKLTEKIIEMQSRISCLNKDIVDRESLLNRILSSKSWYLTKPLRFVMRLLLRPKQLLMKN